MGKFTHITRTSSSPAYARLFLLGIVFMLLLAVPVMAFGAADGARLISEQPIPTDVMDFCENLGIQALRKSEVVF